MFSVGLIFAGLILKSEKKWEEEKDARRWQKWEECEEIRESIGHTTAIVKIPRSKRSSRNKHRY